MGCGEFLVKYILFFANLFFALAGLALLGIGVAIQLKIGAVTGVIEGVYEVGPIASMVVGSVVFVIAFFGCCGAIRESNCMLVTYSIFMIVLMVLKVALATVVFVSADKLVGSVQSEFNRTFTNNSTTFHEIETALSCCGTEGPLSYHQPSPTPVQLPPSCCAPLAVGCTDLNAFPGCNSVAADFIHAFSTAIGVVCIVVAAVELVSVVFGLCLANHVRNRDRRSRYKELFSGELGRYWGGKAALRAREGAAPVFVIEPVCSNGASPLVPYNKADVGLTQTAVRAPAKMTSAGVFKGLLYATNLLFSLAGFALLSVGAGIHLKIGAVTSDIEGAYEVGPITSMMVGSVVIVVAFFGCCGTGLESNCMLVTYFVFVITLMALKVALATVVLLCADQLVTTARSELVRTFINNRPVFNHIETSLNCCGPEGATSYGFFAPSLPSSCCSAGEACTTVNAFPGCISVAADLVHEFSTAVVVLCVVLAVLELVSVVFGLCLANHVRNRDKKLPF